MQVRRLFLVFFFLRSSGQSEVLVYKIQNTIVNITSFSLAPGGLPEPSRPLFTPSDHP